MRPGVEALNRLRIPRVVGVLIHYAVLLGLVGLLLWLVVPRAIDQVQSALGEENLQQQTAEATGWKRDVLEGVQQRLEELPSARELVDPAVEVTVIGFEIFIGIFFVLACAAYWIFEREHAIRLVTSLLPRPRRKVVRDTWDLIDAKLGAYVRGQALLITLVATTLSARLLGDRPALLAARRRLRGLRRDRAGDRAAVAGAVAVGVGFTESVQLGIAAGVIVLVVRLLEDYIVIPKVLGEAVGLSPLLVLVSVFGTAALFGEGAVLLAIPLAAVLATLVDVIVLDKDPAEEEVPTVLFPAQDAE